MNPHMTSAYAAGVLDSSARIYPWGITVYSRHKPLIERLKARYGGSIETAGTRWKTQGWNTRVVLLELWLLHTVDRHEEIKRELERLRFKI